MACASMVLLYHSLKCLQLSQRYLNLFLSNLIGRASHVSFPRRLFVDDIQHLSLNGFFLEHQSVFVPDEVWTLGVEAVSLHATLEQSDDVTIVGVLCETKASAIVHELLELLWLIFAQVLDCRFFLFLFDIRVLFSL